jgi:hypothetical protein
VCLRGCNDISDQNLEAFLVDLGLPKEKAKKLIEVSKNTDRYAQAPRDVIYIFEEDKLEPEEGFIYTKPSVILQNQIILIRRLTKQL